jgi:hypothetical protein
MMGRVEREDRSVAISVALLGCLAVYILGAVAFAVLGSIFHFPRGAGEVVGILLLIGSLMAAAVIMLRDKSRRTDSRRTDSRRTDR